MEAHGSATELLTHEGWLQLPARLDNQARTPPGTHLEAQKAAYR